MRPEQHFWSCGIISLGLGYFHVPGSSPTDSVPLESKGAFATQQWYNKCHLRPSALLCPYSTQACSICCIVTLTFYSPGLASGTANLHKAAKFQIRHLLFSHLLLHLCFATSPSLLALFSDFSSHSSLSALFLDLRLLFRLIFALPFALPTCWLTVFS